MKRKLLALILSLAVLLGMGGCAAVSEVAGDVMAAAQKELEAQMTGILEEYKVEMVEVKTAFGKLNDEGSDWQFFCAALVRAENDTIARACMEAMKGMFEQTGIEPQTGSRVDNPLLVHKEIKFDHSDFSDGTYFVVYGYNSDLSLELPDWTLPEIGRK